MIVRAIDGRYLGHPFFCSIEKSGHGNGCRQRPNSYNLHAKVFESKNSNMKWQLESKTTNCFRQQACTHRRVSSSGGFCVGAQRSLCRGPALSVSGSDAPCRGPALSVSGPGAALCRAPALSGRLCVGRRRHGDRRGLTQRALGPTKNARSLTQRATQRLLGPNTALGAARTQRVPASTRRVCQRALDPDKQSAGPRHRAPGPDPPGPATERRAPTQRALGPTQSAGLRHKPSAGPRRARPRRRERRDSSAGP